MILDATSEQRHSKYFIIMKINAEFASTKHSLIKLWLWGFKTGLREFKEAPFVWLNGWSIAESVYLLYGYNVWSDGAEGTAVVIRCYWNPEGNCVSIFYRTEYSLLPSEWPTPYYKPLAIKHSKALIQKDQADLFLQAQIWMHLISRWGITLLTVFVCSSHQG